MGNGLKIETTGNDWKRRKTSENGWKRPGSGLKRTENDLESLEVKIQNTTLARLKIPSAKKNTIHNDGERKVQRRKCLLNTHAEIEKERSQQLSQQDAEIAKPISATKKGI